MLSRLYIKNIALIKEENIEFDSGLNVLSGETGSGKSVILDSINFVLGSKADKSMIRHGEQEALVKAEFVVDSKSEAIKKLEECDIESDGEIIISRKLSLDGKNVIKVNGNTVTAAMLKSITQHLVDVHGQSEHFFLLKEENQLKVIDGILGNEAENIKENVRQLIYEKKKYVEHINSLGGNEEERARRCDFLDYQIKEIDSAEIKIGEFDELKARQTKILNTEKILIALNTAKAYLSDDGGVSDGLYSAIREINHISDIDEEYNNLSMRMDELSSEISDISETLSDLADDMSFDEGEAQYIDERLTLLKGLRKKYGATEEDIIAYRDRAQAEYDEITDSAATIEECNAKIAVCNEKIYNLYLKLTSLRKQAACAFSKKVETELKSLNIPDAIFTVKFNDYDKNSLKFNSYDGADEICFEFSANKGEPVKPLSKVISGGEMSRFMLAIKTQLKDLNGISTYMFDEIDAGISGYTAGTVAKKFSNISKCTQILAVSHLPQVCAASDVQFLIYKIEDENKTYTKVKKLSAEQKVDEIIRLTGSINSSSARQHAIELINEFKN